MPLTGRESLLRWRLSCPTEGQNTRLCGATLFAKEGRGKNPFVLALFRKEGAARRRRVFFALRPFADATPCSFAPPDPCYTATIALDTSLQPLQLPSKIHFIPQLNPSIKYRFLIVFQKIIHQAV